MSKVIIKSVLTAAVLGVAAGVSLAASAGQFEETVVQGSNSNESAVHISYSAADAATPEGRSLLESRIKYAARKVCGPTGLQQSGSLSISARNQECFEDSVNHALSQIGATSVAQVGE